MKKTYVKPMLSKESFSLTESVATGCGGMELDDLIDVNSNNPDACYFDLGDHEHMFNESNTLCTAGEPEQDMFCYNGMVGGMPVFRS